MNRSIKRAGLALALFLFLPGCHVLLPGIVAATAVPQIPAWLNTAATVVSGLKTLTDAAQVACSVQAYANRTIVAASQKGDAETATAMSRLSADVGRACAW